MCSSWGRDPSSALSEGSSVLMSSCFGGFVLC